MGLFSFYPFTLSFIFPRFVYYSKTNVIFINRWMEKRIVIKEIDKLVSVVSKERVITEYIIYLMVGNTKVEAHTEIGDEAKKLRVNEMILRHFYDDSVRIGDANYPIEEIPFREVYNIKQN